MVKIYWKEAKNVKISKKIFGQTANICCAHFLEEEDKWKSEFKKLKFSVLFFDNFHYLL